MMMAPCASCQLVGRQCVAAKAFNATCTYTAIYIYAEKIHLQNDTLIPHYLSYRHKGMALSNQPVEQQNKSYSVRQLFK